VRLASRKASKVILDKNMINPKIAGFNIAMSFEVVRLLYTFRVARGGELRMPRTKMFQTKIIG
jgi:hypothetical protein